MNNLLSINFDTLYIFLGAILIEFIVFLVIVSKKKLNILRIFFAVLVGNAISTSFCFFLPGTDGEYGLSFYIWLSIAFAIALIFEWLVDIAFFKNRKYTVSNLRFFFCSLIGNLLTFSATITIFALRNGIL
ncbi:MAG: hypothetical protein MJ211_02025 [Bacteroidales bacterium]|nr:hypothetical protein [Bacteroidales bacterium]